jgi:hypothetical protein
MGPRGRNIGTGFSSSGAQDHCPLNDKHSSATVATDLPTKTLESQDAESTKNANGPRPFCSPPQSARGPVNHGEITFDQPPIRFPIQPIHLPVWAVPISTVGVSDGGAKINHGATKRMKIARKKTTVIRRMIWRRCCSGIACQASKKLGCCICERRGIGLEFDRESGWGGGRSDKFAGLKSRNGFARRLYSRA